MTVKDLTTLFDYSYWANSKLEGDSVVPHANHPFPNHVDP